MGFRCCIYLYVIGLHIYTYLRRFILTLINSNVKQYELTPFLFDSKV